MDVGGLLAVVVATSALIIRPPWVVGADLCVGDLQAQSYPSGYACKDVGLVTADDFVYSGLRKAGARSNLSRAAIGAAFATEFPALNGLGLSAARVDVEPGGAVLLHSHPRSAELALIVRGRMLVGFVSTDNVSYRKQVREGDIMALPRGLLHYLINSGNVTATGFAFFSSPTPGLQFTSYALFGSRLPAGIVENSTLLSDPEVKRLMALFGGVAEQSDRCLSKGFPFAADGKGGVGGLARRSDENKC